MSHKEAKKLRQLHRKSAQAAAERAHYETRGLIEQKIAAVDKLVENGIKDVFERRLVNKPKLIPGFIWFSLRRIFVKPEIVAAQTVFVNGVDPLMKFDGKKLESENEKI